jgi:hypothetical protein
MFVSGVLFPVFLVLSLVLDEGGPMIVPVLLFFVSLVLMLYARLFSEETRTMRKQDVQPSTLQSMPARGSLTPGSPIPVPGVSGRTVRTNELAQPPSVTEQTTRLLDNE